MANKSLLNILSKINTVNSNDRDSIPKFSLGQIIDGKYKVLDKLSRTSSEADLYKVTDISNTSLELVLKLYCRKDSVKEQVVSLLKQIKNPNIVEIIDDGKTNGYYYIVTPFYSYGSLASLIEKGVRFSMMI